MDDDYFLRFFVIILLVLLSAVFSGLTLGFFSLNKDDLKRKAKLGDKQAIKVYKVRRDGNLLLCTLLIGNVAVNAALSIFLGSILSGVAAGFVATGLIVIFGEIVPQATFSRNALPWGAKFTWIVHVFIFLLYPVCRPLARVLDKFLGEEMDTVYTKRELIKIIEEHEDNRNSEIDADEERIIKGALSFSDKSVEDIMTPRTEVFALEAGQLLDDNTITEINRRGHSRIPVYRESVDNIIGLLYVKDLIKNDKWHDKKVEEIARNDAIFVDKAKKLDDLLNEFKRTRHHLFIVLNKYGGISGIVTVEDVIEEIIGEEIVDEFDKHEDLQEVAIDRLRIKKIQKV